MRPVRRATHRAASGIKGQASGIKRRVRLCLALAVIASVAAACVPRTEPAAPQRGATGPGCYGYVSAAGENVAAEIKRLWGNHPDGEWLITVVAPRESGCDPCASYPSQHDCGRVFDINRNANGVLQNLSLNNATALKSACPLILPKYSWRYAACSLKVSFWKWQAGGRAPWGG